MAKSIEMNESHQIANDDDRRNEQGDQPTFPSDRPPAETDESDAKPRTRILGRWLSRMVGGRIKSFY